LTVFPLSLGRATNRSGERTPSEEQASSTVLSLRSRSGETAEKTGLERKLHSPCLSSQQNNFSESKTLAIAKITPYI